MILGTSYRDHRGALVATDKVEKRDGSFFHVETGEELEQAPAKMSKSSRTLVNPDDVVEQYGADTLRVYEMFMGPLMLQSLGLKKDWKEAVNSSTVFTVWLQVKKSLRKTMVL